MPSAAQLGISDQEFQDAMNLEKIYNLLSRTNGRCSKCRNSPSHVDCNSFQWLCGSHSVGKANCKKIGADRFNAAEIEKLERKFGGGLRRSASARHLNSNSPALVSSRSDKNRKSRKSKHSSGHQKKRRPRSSSSDRDEESSESKGSENGSDEEFIPVKSRSRSARPAKSHQQPFGAFDDPFSSQTGSNFIPGMAGILQQQQHQLQRGFPGMNEQMHGMGGVGMGGVGMGGAGMGGVGMGGAGMGGVGMGGGPFASQMHGTTTGGVGGSMSGTGMSGNLFAGQMGQNDQMRMGQYHGMVWGQRMPSMFHNLQMVGHPQQSQQPQYPFDRFGNQTMEVSPPNSAMECSRSPFGANQFASQTCQGGNMFSSTGNPFGGGGGGGRGFSNQFLSTGGNTQFQSQLGGTFPNQRSSCSGTLGRGQQRQQQATNPFLSTMGMMTSGNQEQASFYAQQQQGRFPYSNGFVTQQQVQASNPFMSQSNPHMFSSVSSIPNLTAGQRDWWE